eukprot:CAMPEP_0116893804 /NCGR_PEP_ID=MMETSP0467-20121206/3723_1 /TAXON_ID=283647 /ORGANISM="Mesodinium pulex, Strain SPMC105" /LENGTH=128 /DNA_ID=CAMNT_0004563691 /DNA_START=2238 /DNA_END=2624 /DNA_ORIENTATION=-
MDSQVIEYTGNIEDVIVIGLEYLKQKVIFTIEEAVEGMLVLGLSQRLHVLICHSVCEEVEHWFKFFFVVEVFDVAGLAQFGVAALLADVHEMRLFGIQVGVVVESLEHAVQPVEHQILPHFLVFVDFA